ncbi:hypothetical protein GCM10010532_056450 [Dactylosporangium siamense]|uniref:Uncharacterized protein n=1 Tax=Dactylosporangium siamense TaxID=685454 RepID=A0A919PNY8_9ACTN|nr:hypothetical protein Dsi01nite_039010 [Dactylosporangium siamense]
MADSEPSATTPCDSVAHSDAFDTTVEAEARAHNAAAWTALWSQMHGLPTGLLRQLWLAERIRIAVLAYEAENERIQQANAFKPSKTLREPETVTPHGHGVTVRSPLRPVSPRPVGAAARRDDDIHRWRVECRRQAAPESP